MDRYLKYLCEIVGRSYSYENLLRHLHDIEFYSLMPSDDDRELDGNDIRKQFLEDTEGLNSLSVFPNFHCSVLELLIGVAIRLDRDMEGCVYERSVSEWFWILIENLELEYCDDICYEKMGGFEEVERKIDKFLERKYCFNGYGGLFPLKYPEKDQRNVEIWYQMAAWENENYSFY